jgi:hypothetical protein
MAFLYACVLFLEKDLGLIEYGDLGTMQAVLIIFPYF